MTGGAPRIRAVPQSTHGERLAPSSRSSASWLTIPPFHAMSATRARRHKRRQICVTSRRFGPRPRLDPRHIDSGGFPAENIKCVARLMTKKSQCRHPVVLGLGAAATCALEAFLPCHAPLATLMYAPDQRADHCAIGLVRHAEHFITADMDIGSGGQFAQGIDASVEKLSIRSKPFDRHSP